MGAAKGTSTKLPFNCDGRAARGIDRAAIEKQFARFFQTTLDAREVQWQILQDAGPVARGG